MDGDEQHVVDHRDLRSAGHDEWSGHFHGGAEHGDVAAPRQSHDRRPDVRGDAGRQHLQLRLTPANRTIGGEGGTGSITVGTASGCPWTATTTQHGSVSAGPAPRQGRRVTRCRPIRPGHPEPDRSASGRSPSRLRRVSPPVRRLAGGGQAEWLASRRHRLGVAEEVDLSGIGAPEIRARAIEEQRRAGGRRRGSSAPSPAPNHTSQPSNTQGETKLRAAAQSCCASMRSLRSS